MKEKTFQFLRPYFTTHRYLVAYSIILLYFIGIYLFLLCYKFLFMSIISTGLFIVWYYTMLSYDIYESNREIERRVRILYEE